MKHDQKQQPPAENNQWHAVFRATWKQAVDGNEGAFDRLFEQFLSYYSAVEHYWLSSSTSDSIRDEAYSIALVTFTTDWRKFNPDDPLASLRLVCRSACYDALRHTYRRPTLKLYETLVKHDAPEGQEELWKDVQEIHEILRASEWGERGVAYNHSTNLTRREVARVLVWLREKCDRDYPLGTQLLAFLSYFSFSGSETKAGPDRATITAHRRIVSAIPEEWVSELSAENTHWATIVVECRSTTVGYNTLSTYINQAIHAARRSVSGGTATWDTSASCDF